ncbi:MAG: hypothetical protein ACSHWS_16835 [Sulfitobacter sp.]
MRVEHVKALFRPYRITEVEQKEVGHRSNPHGGTVSIVNVVRNSESLISSLEAKTGVLLTHISMMIAVTGLMLAVSGDALWYEVLLACELTAYLLLALLCIRCQLHFGTSHYESICVKGSHKTDKAPSHVYHYAIFGELIYREWLFRFTQATLYILTFLLVCTVFYGLLADEFGVLVGQ